MCTAQKNGLGASQRLSACCCVPCVESRTDYPRGRCVGQTTEQHISCADTATEFSPSKHLISITVPASSFACTSHSKDNGSIAATGDRKMRHITVFPLVNCVYANVELVITSMKLFGFFPRGFDKCPTWH